MSQRNNLKPDLDSPNCLVNLDPDLQGLKRRDIERLSTDERPPAQALHKWLKCHRYQKLICKKSSNVLCVIAAQQHWQEWDYKCI